MDKKYDTSSPKKAAITYCRVAENADEMKDE